MNKNTVTWLTRKNKPIRVRSVARAHGMAVIEDVCRTEGLEHDLLFTVRDDPYCISSIAVKCKNKKGIEICFAFSYVMLEILKNVVLRQMAEKYIVQVSHPVFRLNYESGRYERMK